jgi:nucleotide-binding universal stress UspA family protein
MDRQVVAGFDASQSAVAAVEWAAHEASLRGDSLRIVACYDIPIESAMAPIAMGAIGALLEATEEGARVVLDKVRRDHPTLDAQLDVRAGSAAGVLVRDFSDADLLVVGASGHHGASAFWLGSTARSVARHSSCPVVVVRGRATVGTASRLVVAVDGSSVSDAAVRWAADEADLLHAPVLIVHCWSHAYRSVDASSTQGRDIDEVDAALVLERCVAIARDRCGTEVGSVLVEQATVGALLSTVRDGDLLVVGSPRHGPIVSSIIGSTVNGILEEAAVPVVIVPMVDVALPSPRSNRHSAQHSARHAAHSVR